MEETRKCYIVENPEGYTAIVMVIMEQQYIQFTGDSILLMEEFGVQ